MIALAIVGSTVAGAVAGWFIGLVLCPDPGDIGIGSIPWAFGGAVCGGVAGCAISAALLT